MHGIQGVQGVQGKDELAKRKREYCPVLNEKRFIMPQNTYIKPMF